MVKCIGLVFALTATLAAGLDFSNLKPFEVQRDTNGNILFKHGGRITGGRPAEKGQFPHQVVLFLSQGNATYLCGGSLISDQWILTAAHCLDGKESAEVRLGTNFLDTEAPVTLQVQPDAFTIHNNWNSAKAVNDIALLRLPKSVQFSEKIRPISLPRLSQASSTFEGAEVIASGWGKTTDDEPYISKELNYIVTNVETLVVCKILYFFKVNDNHVCIKTDEGKSTCGGDSGGPLKTVDENGEPILIGITSFGSASGCENAFPTVFARVGAYLSWITQNTGIPIRE